MLPYSDSLPIWLLEPTDIDQLAEVIETALVHFTTCHSSYEAVYLKQLCIIRDCHQLVLNALNEEPPPLSLEAIDLRERSLPSLALRIADMIHTLADKIRLLEAPWYYPHFCQAVTAILSSKMSYRSSLSAAQILLDKIVPSKRRYGHEIF